MTYKCKTCGNDYVVKREVNYITITPGLLKEEMWKLSAQTIRELLSATPLITDVSDRTAEPLEDQRLI